MPAIYILRHGEAEPSAPGGSDQARKLTRRGAADIESLALETFASGHEPLGIVFHSPYRRAVETAEILSRPLANIVLETTAVLAPSGGPEAALNFLAGQDKDVALVSHMPLTAELALALTGRRLPFFPGTCVKVSRATPFELNAAFSWVRHPPLDR